MNRIIGKSWRDSASLIVLSKRGRESLRHKQAGVNYEVLLQTRTSKTSFPNSVVFPGGLYEASDASTDWLNLLRSFGYTNKDFDALHHVGDAVTPIFQPDPAKRHVALRITAIRETFEELGLLLCSRLHKSNRGSFGVHAVTDVNIKHWQDRVSKNPEELLNLCKEYNCYPDIWSLHYWSNWLTPASIPKRFNTAFFVTAFESEPPELLSNSEVVSVQWSSPSEVLDQNNRKEVELYPPQVYELNRFLHFEDIEKFIAFAQERSCHSNEVLFPVVIKTKDGKLHVLPGDDIYPSVVDFDNDLIQEYKDKTIPELRESSTRLHRFEITYGNPTAYFVLQNYKPLNHINMDNKVIKTTVTIPKNKK